MIVKLDAFTRFFVFAAVIIGLVTAGLNVSAGQVESQSIFIPIYQHFSFEQGRIVDSDFGDITVLDEGIETTLPGEELAALNKGFLEDLKELPSDKEIPWMDYAGYETDMIYAVKDTKNKYSIFELIEVQISDDYVIGIEIKYRYQPDGSRSF